GFAAAPRRATTPRRPAAPRAWPRPCGPRRRAGSAAPRCRRRRRASAGGAPPHRRAGRRTAPSRRDAAAPVPARPRNDNRGVMEDRLHGRAREHAALRRVATLVAQGASVADLTAAMAEEIAAVLDVTMVTLDRYDDGSSVVLASFNDPGFPPGSRW